MAEHLCFNLASCVLKHTYLWTLMASLLEWDPLNVWTSKKITKKRKATELQNAYSYIYIKIKKFSLKSIVLDKKQRNLLQKKKWEKRQKRTAAREWPVMECMTDVPSNAWLSLASLSHRWSTGEPVHRESLSYTPDAWANTPGQIRSPDVAMNAGP